MSQHSAYDMIHANAFSVNDLCSISLYVCCDCLYYNDEKYESNSIINSGFVEAVYRLFSNDTFKNHPIKIILMKWIGDKPFDLAHLKTVFPERYKDLPGIRISESRHDHKRVSVFFEWSSWATVGQLLEIEKEDLEKWMITVKSQVGTIQL